MCAGFRVAESGNVLLSQPGNRNSRAVRSFAIPAFISLNRPQGALDFGSKYNVAHSLKTTGEMDVTDAQSFFRAFPPTLPGIAPMLNPPLAAHGGYANQVHSLTSSETTRE